MHPYRRSERTVTEPVMKPKPSLYLRLLTSPGVFAIATLIAPFAIMGITYGAGLTWLRIAYNLEPRDNAHYISVPETMVVGALVCLVIAFIYWIVSVIAQPIFKNMIESRILNLTHEELASMPLAQIDELYTQRCKRSDCLNPDDKILIKLRPYSTWKEPWPKPIK